MRVRPEAGGEWALEKHEFYMALHYAMGYRKWLTARAALLGARSIDTSGSGVRSSLPGDPTGSAAERLATINEHIRLIEETAQEAGGDIAPWILIGCTSEYVTYNALAQGFGSRGEPITPMPCGKNYYYKRRRKFYFLLAKKLLGEIK